MNAPNNQDGGQQNAEAVGSSALVRPESDDSWYVRDQNGKPMWKFIMPSKGSGSIDNFDFVNESFIRKCANIMLGKPVTHDGADSLSVTKSG